MPAHAAPAPVETLKKLRVAIRAAQQHSSWIERQCGVSGAQLWLLCELREEGGLRVGELAARLAIHQTTASNLIDSLERGDYVVKERSEADQRVVTVRLTAAGRQMVRKAPVPARGLLLEALKKMDKNLLAQLDGGLDAMLAAMGVNDTAEGLELLPFMTRRARK